MLRDDLVEYLNNLLQADKFKDYCPNGLQIQGADIVKRIICGVSLNEQLIDTAIEKSADTIIVHHGAFWNKDSYPIIGIKHKRISKIIKNEINLIAYHLPLDCHEVLGNNAMLAKLLEISVHGQTAEQNLLWYGELSNTLTAAKFAEFYTHKTNHTPLLLGNPEKHIKKIAWCTGGADNFFEHAINSGVDCFISGEVKEPIKSLADESGVVYLAGGHYVTERYGIKALSYHLNSIGLNSEFIEIYNPV